uniref:Uncharacterized protein n=1 Tax=Moniliophthora roreri TaxID=221103 RepID=A0A0W0EYN6_MONRR
MPTYQRLQQYALAIGVISIMYNGAEEATIVMWRFWNVALPGEEKAKVLASRELRFEKIATIGIAFHLIALALATKGTVIFGLVTHDEPTTSNASLIVSASALFLMVAIWLPKRYLERSTAVLCREKHNAHSHAYK